MVTKSEQEILRQASKLVSQRDLESAKDLLHRYISQVNDSKAINRALGKLYLDEKQSELAAQYLERALKLPTRAGCSSDQESGLIGFGGDDFEYLSEKRRELEEEVFSFTEEEPDAEATKVPSTPPKPERKVLSISNSDNEKQDDKVVRLPVDFTLSSNQLDVSVRIGNRKLHQGEEQSSQQAPEDEVEEASDQTYDFKQLDFLEEEPELSSLSHQYELDNLAIEDVEDLSQEDDIDEDYDEYTDTPDPGTLPPLALDEDAEDVWEPDYDDDLLLDDYQDDASTDSFQDVSSYITKEVKARQAAAELIVKTEWEHDGLALLTDIFSESGYGQTRIALTNAINQGISLDDLKLAKGLREYWSQSEQYWTTFHRIKSESKFQQTEDAYSNLSWAEAFRIIDSFVGTPSYEEVIFFLEDLFDQWYSSSRLRKVFKAFFYFLKYRLGRGKRTLPVDCPVSFGSIEFDEVGVDSSEYLSRISPRSRKLQELGINLIDSPFEHKFDVIFDEETYNDRGK